MPDLSHVGNRRDANQGQISTAHVTSRRLLCFLFFQYIGELQYILETAWARVTALHACVFRLMSVVLEQIRTVYTRSWNSMKLAAEQSLLHICQDGALEAYITVQITSPTPPHIQLCWAGRQLGPDL